jgi:hypothetical protein
MRAVLAAALLFACGCRATAATDDGGGGDLTKPEDASDHADHAFLPDFARPGDGSCPAADGGGEICNDGCDNDGNGYIDGEDPGCKPIALAGMAGGDALRFHLDSGATAPFLSSLGTWSGAVAWRRAVSPDAWLTYEAPLLMLVRVDLATQMQTPVERGYYARDVCFFGGNLIVVEVSPTMPSGTLHQLKPDGTELAKFPVAAGAPAACASDGQLLWVPVHNGAARSKLQAFDATLTPGVSRPIPAALTEDRCLDLAFTRFGLYGLFTVSGGGVDAALSASAVWPFALDGGVGAPVPAPDGGMKIHSLGEFAP